MHIANVCKQNFFIPYKFNKRNNEQIHYSLVAMKIIMLCSTKTNLIFKCGESRILLYSALYDESRYVKTVVIISLARYRNSRYTVACCIHLKL